MYMLGLLRPFSRINTVKNDEILCFSPWCQRKRNQYENG